MFKNQTCSRTRLDVQELDMFKNQTCSRTLLNPTYKNTSFDKEEIWANHKLFMSSMDFPINEENDDLPALYWIPKLDRK